MECKCFNPYNLPFQTVKHAIKPTNQQQTFFVVAGAELISLVCTLPVCHFNKEAEMRKKKRLCFC